MDTSEAETVYNDILSSHPNHLAAHISFVQNIESTATIKVNYPFSFENLICSQSSGEDASKKVDLEKFTTVLKKIVNLTEMVINGTDKQALLAYYGIKLDSRPEATELKK